MSTTPSRIGLVGPTLRSLHEQSRRPDAVLLAVPPVSVREQRPYEIPPEVVEFERLGLVEVVRCARDEGPGTKLLGCLDRVGDDDVFICADDDLAYHPFVIDELASAVAATSGAASFHVYENLGLRVGQGADGFAMPGWAARRCTEIRPLIAEYASLRSHDDYWISFVLARHGVRIVDLAPRLAVHGADRPYVPVHDVNGLLAASADGRRSLNRTCHRLLYRHGRPSLRMRLATIAGLFSGARRVLARRWRGLIDQRDTARR